MIFDGFPGGPGAEGPLPGVGICLAPGPHWSKQTVLSRSSTCKIHYRTCRNKGIRKNQDANYEITQNEGCNMNSLKREEPGYRIDETPRSLVPLFEGPADNRILFFQRCVTGLGLGGKYCLPGTLCQWPWPLSLFRCDRGCAP